jgi:hypothetical protein
MSGKRVRQKRKSTSPLLRQCREQWDANRKRLDDAGYHPGPKIRCILDGGRVTITEDRCGVTVGWVPTALKDRAGNVLDLSDPALAADQGATEAWLLLAWYYLTGETPGLH